MCKLLGPFAVIPPSGSWDQCPQTWEESCPRPLEERGGRWPHFSSTFQKLGVRQDFYTWSSLCPSPLARIFISCGCCNKSATAWVTSNQKCILSQFWWPKFRLTCQQGPTPLKPPREDPSLALRLLVGASEPWHSLSCSQHPLPMSASLLAWPPPCGPSLYVAFSRRICTQISLFSKDPSLQMRTRPNPL